MRAAFAVFALVLNIFASAPAADEAEQHLTLDQGRTLALHALKTGKPQLTLQLSKALLQADPKDPLAYLLQAAAHAKLNDAREARKSAVLAYRFSTSGSDKFQAAQMVSRLALASGSPTLSQVWLRRTAIHAPDENSKELIAKDYQTLRLINHWAFRIRTELKPSSNVNNGSDTTLEIIDGTPSLGSRFGPRSVALSGVIGTVDLTASRRLRQSQRSLTSMSGRIYIQRVALSSSAKDLAAALAAASGTTVPENSEFGSTYAELSVRHAFAVGPAQKRGAASVALTTGTSWYGEQENYNLAKFTGSRSWQLSPDTGLVIDGMVEERFDARSLSYKATILGFGTSLSHRLENGDKLKLTLGLRDADSGHVNSSHSAASVRLGYDFGKSLGSVRFSTGLILGYSDYPVYLAGFPVTPLTNGRQDKSIYADVNMLFERYDYAGFAPVLRLRAGRKFSNHSRFETKEFSLSLGIESKF
ncbi:tetratricopeptide repeat protein [Parasedimentitalea psychrophila]|uniref:DUF560 domain-containing protein n=1 Tax=Parasedimentitalea psychrophila TaxID=2997337 RepID=A0A9Y2L5K3_9RHOB|nr:hypothetical protein [Parasedimentitalea psychrophila]WIY27334.1 hypothetical protein QPJ95_10685 [Parasedimentitalea psychrophila]